MQLYDNTSVCPRCGIPVDTGNQSYTYQQPMVHCRNCGAQIAPGTPVCAACGAPTGNVPIQQYGQQPGYQEPVNAGFVVLAIFVPLFGIIYGAIKMNSGQKKSGQVYLWVGIGVMAFNFIVGLISGILAASYFPYLLY